MYWENTSTKSRFKNNLTGKFIKKQINYDLEIYYICIGIPRWKQIYLHGRLEFFFNICKEFSGSLQKCVIKYRMTCKNKIQLQSLQSQGLSARDLFWEGLMLLANKSWK